MNTESLNAVVAKASASAVVALVITLAMSWSFVDSTRVARWVTAADVAASAASQVDTSTLGGSLKAGLLQ